MSNSNMNSETTTEILPADMIQLQEAISALPADMKNIVGPIMDRVLDSTKRRRKILNLVQDALGQLRLDMKYLVFDLEATRRERDGFKTQLGDDEK